MVDDNILNFLPYPENGIPVPPYYGDAGDRYLPGVVPLLRALHNEQDVRPVLQVAERLSCPHSDQRVHGVRCIPRRSACA
jgi:TFIIF-interacting CTD phosphatase-like protein